VNWETEVTVGVGASESLYAIMQSFVNPGDEVVLISPAFDIYRCVLCHTWPWFVCVCVCVFVSHAHRPVGDCRASCAPRRALQRSSGLGWRQVRVCAAALEAHGCRPHRAGYVLHLVCVSAPCCHRMRSAHSLPLTAEWTLDMAELRAAFTPATRAIIINTPQNPTGKMFSRDELESIRAILADYPRVLAISDEVYEHITYDDREHVRLASLPGMWDRCLTVSSSGKTFSITGWKVGYVCLPARACAFPFARAAVCTHTSICADLHCYVLRPCDTTRAVGLWATPT
ncbi:aminotransferase class I/II-fold pyridoxal phosphate-dependent enzyme, partial [archaeon]